MGEGGRDGRPEEERQDSGIGLDQEVEMGLRELRLDERTQAERRGKGRADVDVRQVPAAAIGVAGVSS